MVKLHKQHSKYTGVNTELPQCLTYTFIPQAGTLFIGINFI